MKQRLMDSETRHWGPKTGQHRDVRIKACIWQSFGHCPEEDHDHCNRANQVVSPSGTSTFDGTRTISSATSEPITEIASRTSRQSKRSESVTSQTAATAKSSSNGTNQKSSSNVQRSGSGKSSNSQKSLLKPAASPYPNGTKSSSCSGRRREGRKW